MRFGVVFPSSGYRRKMASLHFIGVMTTEPTQTHTSLLAMLYSRSYTQTCKQTFTQAYTRRYKCHKLHTLHYSPSSLCYANCVVGVEFMPCKHTLSILQFDPQCGKYRWAKRTVKLRLRHARQIGVEPAMR